MPDVGRWTVGLMIAGVGLFALYLASRAEDTVMYYTGREIEREQAHSRNHQSDCPASDIGHRCSPPRISVARQHFPS